MMVTRMTPNMTQQLISLTLLLNFSMLSANMVANTMTSFPNITTFKIGDRVRLIRTDDKYTTLSPGDEGVVGDINYHKSGAIVPTAITQIWIEWDEGSGLAMIPEAGDIIKLVETKTEDEDHSCNDSCLSHTEHCDGYCDHINRHNMCQGDS